MITLAMLQRLWPHGDSHIPGLIEGIVSSSVSVFAEYGLDSPLTVAHAMAQFSHECGAGTEIVENLNYSSQRMMQVWPSRFHSLADTLHFAHNPQALANKVYNGRMGNRTGTNDGWNYRGRGASQTTGREGYENLSGASKLNLIDHPDLVTSPDTFLECGVADFVLCGCLPFAKADDIFHVTQHLNGGQVGADQRKAWLHQWKRALGIGDFN